MRDYSKNTLPPTVPRSDSMQAHCHNSKTGVCAHAITRSTHLCIDSTKYICPGWE